jgi:hypothetical protein
MYVLCVGANFRRCSLHFSLSLSQVKRSTIIKKFTRMIPCSSFVLQAEFVDTETANPEVLFAVTVNPADIMRSYDENVPVHYGEDTRRSNEAELFDVIVVKGSVNSPAAIVPDVIVPDVIAPDVIGPVIEVNEMNVLYADQSEPVSTIVAKSQTSVIPRNKSFISF